MAIGEWFTAAQHAAAFVTNTVSDAISTPIEEEQHLDPLSTLFQLAIPAIASEILAEKIDPTRVSTAIYPGYKPGIKNHMLVWFPPTPDQGKKREDARVSINNFHKVLAPLRWVRDYYGKDNNPIIKEVAAMATKSLECLKLTYAGRRDTSGIFETLASIFDVLRDIQLGDRYPHAVDTTVLPEHDVIIRIKQNWASTLADTHGMMKARIVGAIETHNEALTERYILIIRK